MIKKQYKTQKEKDDLVSIYKEKGYRVREEHLHVDGKFIVFGPKTDYHKMSEETKKWDFDISNYIEDEVRPKRNKRLQETDHLMLSDTNALLTKDEQTELIKYRQSLRDLPETLIDEDKAMNIIWPKNKEK